MEIRDLDYIQFGIYSHENVIKNSVCEITNPKLTGSNSVYDERLGVMESNKKCITCGLTDKRCVGHFGHIILKIPVLHPLFHKLIMFILKCICFHCNRILLFKEQLELNGILKYHKQSRFIKIVEKMEKVDICNHCSTTQPRYVFNSQEKNFNMIFKQQGDINRISITENDIKNIFDHISDEDVTLLGFDPKHFHPKFLILTALPVIPPVARPFVIADNMTCDDDLTIQYQEIIKTNLHIADVEINSTKKSKYIQALKFKIKSLFDNSGDRQRVSNGRPLKGIKKRLTGKEGLIRNNLMGKRVDKSARTVIGPDPTLEVDQIAIPQHIADILCYPVRVTKYNKEQIYKWIKENKVNFLLRGDIRINMKYACKKQGTRLIYGDVIFRKGKMILIEKENQIFSLQEGDLLYRDGKQITNIEYNKFRPIEIFDGDIIERKLQNDDILLLNRQPTLHKGSMIAQRIVIRPGKTIRMNLAITKSFNADFDGDEMNLHCPATPETEAELRLLSSLGQNLMSHQSSSANIVIVQDSLLGIYFMTHSNCILKKEQFFQIADIIYKNRLDENLWYKINLYRKKKNISSTDFFDGKMLFSLLLPNNFFFIDNNRLDDNEPDLIIDEGILISGIIGKTNLSSSSSKSFISLFFREYGEKITMNFINNVQFIAMKYLLFRGFSIGIDDCLIKKRDEIQSKISQAFLKAKSIEEHTKDPKIKELYVLFALSNARDTGMAISQKALAKDNNFVASVKSGAKGDYFNIAQISGLLGQQNLNGERIKPLLSNYSRTLPHYPISIDDYQSEDIRFESAGFIRSSFIDGLNPREFFFHAMTGRQGITDTAMKTATSGYIQRRMIKIAEDVQVKYDGTVRNSVGKIIQFCYGDNFLDPVQTSFKNQQSIPCDISRIVQKANWQFKQKQNSSLS